MTVRLSAACSALALLSAIPALAADVEAQSRIDSVIVYPDAASVTRAADVDLQAGATTLVFRGLPMGLDPASLRVSAKGEAALSIGAVETRVAPEPPRDGGLEARLKSLRSDREGWQSTLDALEAKKAMILRFSQSGPEKLSPDAKPLDIGQWGNAWDAVGQAMAKIGDELIAARAKAKNLDDQIAAAEQSRQRPSQGRTTREAAVALDAAAAGKGQVSLTYRVAGAGWQTAYDARLDTNVGGKAALELVRRAAVTQRTGEDWSDVSLSVSTTRAQGGAQAPEVTTQRLSFWEPPAPAVLAPAAPRAAPMAAQSLAKSSDAAPASAPVFKPAEEQRATLDAGAYQASFLAPGRVSVPGDGSSKGFLISSTKYAPDLLIRVAPAIDTSAYLQARIVNAEDAPLLPGAVNIVRDGEFVGVSRIGLVAPGDSTDLGFGVDDRVRARRDPVKRKENEPSWIGSTRTEQREYKTTLKNLHPFAVKVNVVDRIPISENSAIVVEQGPATTPPTDKAVDNKRGVMGWTFDLAPNAEKAITLAWRTKWPADRDVVADTPPGGK
jgi:uncharacterized protein (TIGR02231 family)